VLRNTQGKAVWSSKTHGNPASKLKLQNDGNLVIYKSFGFPAWASKSGGIITFSWYDTSKYGDKTRTKDKSPSEWLLKANANWMAKLSDTVKLRDISIPGTHDTSANTGGPFCETQSWSITDQLKAGIRFLDIRLKPSGEGFAIHHGICYLHMNFNDVMKMVTGFLQKHPGETLLMRVKQENSDASKEVFMTNWKKAMSKYQKWFIKGEQSKNITLGEARGKILIMNDAPGDLDLGGIEWKSDSGKMILQDSYTIKFILGKDSKGITSDKKKELISKYLERAKTSKRFTFNHISATGLGSVDSNDATKALGRLPYALSKKFNNHVYKEIGNSKGKQRVGIIVMDYPGEALIYRIVASNWAL
jgi:1-phosphatidylinositol phosphodiesterase